MKKIDLLVTNGLVITMDKEMRLIENGAVAVFGDQIIDVAEAERFKDVPAEKSIDAQNGIILPGLINTHTHTPMTIFRGLADDLPLETWLNDNIFPAEAAFISPDNVRIGAMLACAEMLLSGTTCFCGGYFLEDHVAEVVVEVGMRAVLGQGVIDFPAPGVPDPIENITAAAAYVNSWSQRSKLIKPSIFCHSPYTCSSQTLKTAKNKALEMDVLFQIHVAETSHESSMIQEGDGMSPVQYLDKIGVLDPDTLLIHGVWVDDTDIETIRTKGCGVSHNPESNMKLASGIAPLQKYLQSQIPVGLGTDGCASNNNLDMLQEMDMAAKLHKVNTMDPTVMDADSVLKMATIEAARVIGLEDRVGSLEKGKQADIIIIDTQQPHLVPLYNPISQVVYSASGSDVRDVIVAGNVLVQGRSLTTFDLEGVLNEAHLLSREIAASQKKKT